jgi:hypothetical protein
LIADSVHRTFNPRDVLIFLCGLLKLEWITALAPR